MPAGEDAVFARIKHLVIARTLHHYYDNKDDQLRDRLHRRFAATGLAPDAYLRLLEADDAREWADLESEITINETFFFRFAEQFGALHDTILPALVQARAASRRLRIWSAGCSTGAEPYSVAILLHRLLGPSLPEWSITILGTDIDEAALRIARGGEYNDWALRTLSPEERRRDFIPVSADGRSQRWALRPAFRSMVRFEKHNLLDTLRAAPAGDAFDLILCRNVLIYFHQDTVRALVRGFGRALAQDGWLLLGHAEAVGHTLDELRPVSLDGTVVWRRAEAPGRAAEEPATRLVEASGTVRPQRSSALRSALRKAVGVARRPAGPRKAAVASPTAAPIAGAAVDDAASAIEQVRVLADGGRPAEALLHCRAALLDHPLCAELFFYAALLHRTLDSPDDAEGDFRRAIYLRKGFVMAHYHLGLLLAETGREGAGRKAIAEARRIARDLDQDAPLPCGDGMTAGRLRALNQDRLFPGPAA